MLRRFFILLTLTLSLVCSARNYQTHSQKIESADGTAFRVKIIEPKEKSGPVPGILWIHGGGYMLGGTFMLSMTCAPMLAETGAVVVFPDYRLAWQSPYPAALEDCYAALEWMFTTEICTPLICFAPVTNKANRLEERCLRSFGEYLNNN